MSNKKKIRAMFALIVLTIFILLPVCDAQAMAPVATTSGTAAGVYLPGSAPITTTSGTAAGVYLPGSAPIATTSGAAAGVSLPGSKPIQQTANKYGSVYYEQQPRSKKQAMSAMSFVKPKLDPITRQNMGGAPPLPPKPVLVPVPIVPEIHPMSHRKVVEFVDKALDALPRRGLQHDEIAPDEIIAGRDKEEKTITDKLFDFIRGKEKGAPDKGVPDSIGPDTPDIIRQLNKEKNLFNTPASFSNIDDAYSCAMPGVPGAEASGPGFQSSEKVTPTAVKFQKPGGGGAGGSKMLESSGGFDRGGGGGGGGDSGPAAAFSQAMQRMEYLQTITNWGAETYTNGMTMAAAIEEFLNDPNTQEEYGAELAALGTPEDWAKMGEAMAGAWDGLKFTAELYAEGLGVFQKMTNAVLDGGGQGAGTLLYQYEGLKYMCQGVSDCGSILQSEGNAAKAAVEVENIQRQLENVNQDPELSSSERRAKRNKLETALRKAEQKMAKERAGASPAAFNEYSTAKKKLENQIKKTPEIQEAYNELESMKQEHGDVNLKMTEIGGQITTIKKTAEGEKRELTKSESEKIKKLEKEHKDLHDTQKKMNELSNEINENPEVAKAREKFDQFKKEFSGKRGVGTMTKASVQYRLEKLAEEKGFQSVNDMKRYYAIKEGNNKIEQILGTASEEASSLYPEGREATGYFSSLEQLEAVIEASEQFLDPEKFEEFKEQAKEYRERANAIQTRLNGINEELAAHGPPEEGGDGSMTEEEYQALLEEQRELMETMQDLSGDTAKTFKEILTELAEMSSEALHDWWKRANAGLMEVPGDPCYEDAPDGCSIECLPAAIYGQQDIARAEAEARGALPPPPPTPSPAPTPPSPIPGGAPAGGAAPSGPTPVPGTGGFVANVLNRITGFGSGGGGIGGEGGAAGEGGQGGASVGEGGAGGAAAGEGEGEGEGGEEPADGDLPIPEGSAANCVTNPECPSLPQPEEGGGGGRAEPPNLGKIAKDWGGTKLKEWEPPQETLAGQFTQDPEDESDEEVDDAKEDRMGLIDRIARDHGLVSTSNPGVYKDPETGTLYVPDARGKGFIVQTGAGIAKNDAAAGDVDDAQTGLTNAQATGDEDDIQDAQNNLDTANDNYQRTVSIPTSEEEQDELEIITRALDNKLLKSVVIKTKAKIPNPNLRTPEQQAAYHKSINENLKIALAAVKKRYSKEGIYSAFEMYAAMQEVYEGFIDDSTEEGKQIKAEGEKLRKDIEEMTDEMFFDKIDGFHKQLKGALQEANEIAAEYEAEINAEKGTIKKQQEIESTASGTVLAGGSYASSPLSMAREQIDRSRKALSSLVNEANAKLKPLSEKVENLKKEINKAKDKILDDFDKLAEKKRNAPGLKDHLRDKDGKITEKGMIFDGLKAAEKANFANEFNKDALGTMKDMLSSLSGGVQVSGAGARQPVSVGDLKFPTSFTAGGNLIARPLSDFTLGDTTYAMKRAETNADIKLKVKDSAPTFDALMKVMEVKGNNFRAINTGLNRLRSLKANLDAGNMPEQLKKEINEGKWSGKNGKEKSNAPDFTSMKKQYESSIEKARESAAPKTPIQSAKTPAKSSGPAVPSPTPMQGGFILITGADSYLSLKQGGSGVSPERQNFIEGTVNHESALKNDIADFSKLASHIQKDIQQEIADSGFTGYRQNALNHAGRQMDNAEFLKSLADAEKELRKMISDKQRELDKKYADLDAEKKAKHKAIIKEKDEKLKSCTSPECRAQIIQETVDKINALDEEYDPLIEEARKEKDEFKTDSEIAKALEEVKELRYQATKRAMKDEIDRLKMKAAIAAGDYATAMEIDDTYNFKNLKSISFFEGNVFEGIDKKIKEKSAKLEQKALQGANMLDNLRETLHEKGGNLASLKGKKIEWTDIGPGSSAKDVKKWINQVNDALGLKGENRIDVSKMCSECSDEQLESLALYWGTFGLGVAKQVEGTYTDEDTARGYYKMGEMKRKHKDLSGAMVDMQAAAAFGIEPPSGSAALTQIRQIQSEMTGKMVQRLIIDIFCDPLNLLFLGFVTGAFKVAKGVQAISAIGRGALKTTKVLGNVAKAGLKLVESTRVFKAIPGATKVINTGKKVVKAGVAAADKAIDVMKGGGKATRKNIKAMSETLENLNREERTARKAGNLKKASQLADQAEDQKKLLKTLKDAHKNTNLWKKPWTKPKGQTAVKNLGEAAIGKFDEAMKAGAKGDVKKAAKAMQEFRKLGDHFNDVKKGRDAAAAAKAGVIVKGLNALGIKPKGKVGKAVDAWRQTVKNNRNLVNAMNNVHRGVEQGMDAAALSNRVNVVNTARRMLENSQSTVNAIKYMGFTGRAWRGVTNFIAEAPYKTGFRSRPAKVVAARNGVNYAENALRGALESGDMNAIRNTWGFLENSKGRLRMVKTMEDLPPVIRAREAPPKPKPIAESPTPLADAGRVIDDTPPQTVDEFVENFRRDADDLASKGDEVGARNARQRAQNLEDSGEMPTRVAVEEPRRPPTEEIPTREVKPVEIPPEEIKEIKRLETNLFNAKEEKKAIEEALLAATPGTDEYKALQMKLEVIGKRVDDVEIEMTVKKTENTMKNLINREAEINDELKDLQKTAADLLDQRDKGLISPDEYGGDLLFRVDMPRERLVNELADVRIKREAIEETLDTLRKDFPEVFRPKPPKIGAEDARTDFLKAIGMTEERSTLYRIKEADNKFYPAKHDKVDDLLRDKLDLVKKKDDPDFFEITDDFRKSSVENFGDSFGVSARDQVRYKKGTQWIKEEDALKEIRKSIDSAMDQGKAATKGAYDEFAERLNEINRQAGREENWLIKVDPDGQPVIYFENRRMGALDEFAQGPEREFFGGMINEAKRKASNSAFNDALDMRAKRIATERGIPVKQAKYEEAAKLYEGQQIRLDDIRGRGADLRAQGKFDDAAKLDSEYRGLSAQQDALFDIRQKSYDDWQKAVPEEVPLPKEAPPKGPTLEEAVIGGKKVQVKKVQAVDKDQVRTIDNIDNLAENLKKNKNAGWYYDPDRESWMVWHPDPKDYKKIKVSYPAHADKPLRGGVSYTPKTFNEGIEKLRAKLGFKELSKTEFPDEVKNFRNQQVKGLEDTLGRRLYRDIDDIIEGKPVKIPEPTESLEDLIRSHPGVKEEIYRITMPEEYVGRDIPISHKDVEVYGRTKITKENIVDAANVKLGDDVYGMKVVVDFDPSRDPKDAAVLFLSDPVDLLGEIGESTVVHHRAGFTTLGGEFKEAASNEDRLRRMFSFQIKVEGIEKGKPKIIFMEHSGESIVWQRNGGMVIDQKMMQMAEDEVLRRIDPELWTDSLKQISPPEFPGMGSLDTLTPDGKIRRLEKYERALDVPEAVKAKISAEMPSFAPRKVPSPAAKADRITGVSDAEKAAAKNLPSAGARDIHVDDVLGRASPEVLQELHAKGLYDEFVETLRGQQVEFWQPPAVIERQLDEAAESMRKFLGEKDIDAPTNFNKAVKGSIEAPIGGRPVGFSDAANKFNDDFAGAIVKSKEDRTLVNWYGAGKWDDSVPSPEAMQKTFDSLRHGKLNDEFISSFVDTMKKQGRSPEEIANFENGLKRMKYYMGQEDEVDALQQGIKNAQVANNPMEEVAVKVKLEQKLQELDAIKAKYGAPAKKPTTAFAPKKVPTKPVSKLQQKVEEAHSTLKQAVEPTMPAKTPPATSAPGAVKIGKNELNSWYNGRSAGELGVENVHRKGGVYTLTIDGKNVQLTSPDMAKLMKGEMPEAVAKAQQGPKSLEEIVNLFDSNLIASRISSGEASLVSGGAKFQPITNWAGLKGDVDLSRVYSATASSKKGFIVEHGDASFMLGNKAGAGELLNGVDVNNARNMKFITISTSHGVDPVGRTAGSTLTFMVSENNADAIIKLIQTDPNVASGIAQHIFKQHKLSGKPGAKDFISYLKGQTPEIIEGSTHMPFA